MKPFNAPKQYTRTDSPKILISACLLGERVRYDAKLLDIKSQQILYWQQQNLLVPLCPEVLGGLATPRAKAELNVQRQAWTEDGKNLSTFFQQGAEKALQLAKQHQVIMAILKSKSPSCGNQKIYNGDFEGILIQGQGITAKLLSENGIAVFNENQLASARDFYLENAFG
ncbi:MAG: hypothetical protein COW84_04145 [Gammaproteobacteria bacterium CG22_combo_CG10-13_8_21_14_all_40_8]|nr:MAG: hypothetical protein COW84_04145 [Gammaproteobacteria bacterium CG22_combo_CG10-13_8_21_14_all_40_8]